MTAHVLYPALDPDLPATFSRAIVHDLLRGTLGFEGVCITDALEMKGAAAGRTPAEVARLALAAGCDLALFAFHDEALRRTLFEVNTLGTINGTLAALELARALADGAFDRAGIDAARPRLAAFDQAHPEPTAAEQARPLDALTPRDWEPRLERIVERGIESRGVLPPELAVRPWRVTEPSFPHGPTLREELAALSIPLESASGEAVEVVAVMSRVPLAGEEITRLRALSRERATVLVGLQNDAFLDQVPEALLRVSTADATPLTRRVLARTLARALRAAMESRA